MSALSKIYYASTTGGGSAACTKADPGTLDRAITLALAWIAAGNANCWIICRGGNYYLSAPLDASTHAGIEFRNYPGETAVFSAGRLLTGSWSGPDADGVYSLSGVTGSFRDLYTGDIRATRARSASNPAGFTISDVGITDSNSYISSLARPQDVEMVGKNVWKFFKVRVTAAVGTAITCRAGDLARARYQNPYNFNSVYWYENAQELVKNGQGYWYHNRSTNTLYYKPRTGENMATLEVIAGNLEQVVTHTGSLGQSAQNLIFRGIQFKHTTWLYPDTYGYTPLQAGILLAASDGSAYVKPTAAVQLYSSNAVKFYGCTFNHLGSVGVAVEYGSADTIIYNNTFTDVGGSAVMVGDVTHLTTDPWPSNPLAKISGTIIYNNLMDRVGSLWYDQCAIWCGYPNNTLIDRNDITNVPYTGISLGWGWGYNDPPGYLSSGWPYGFVAAPVTATSCSANTITRNKIVNWSQETYDSGAIYLNGNSPNSYCQYNYAGASGAGGGLSQAFYHDNGCSGWTTRYNVVETPGVTRWAYLQNGFAPRAVYNTLSDNFALNGITDTYDASNTVANNTVGAFGVDALAIKADAGRL